MWILVIIYIVLLIVSIFFTKYIGINIIVIENLAKGLGEKCTLNTDCAYGNVCCKKKSKQKKDPSGNLILNNLGDPEMEDIFYDKYLNEEGECSIPCISAGSWCDYTGNLEKRQCANKNDNENKDLNILNDLYGADNEMNKFLKNSEDNLLSIANSITNRINRSIDNIDF